MNEREYAEILRGEKDKCIKEINKDEDQLHFIYCKPEREFRKGFIKGLEQSIEMITIKSQDNTTPELKIEIGDNADKLIRIKELTLYSLQELIVNKRYDNV